MNIEDIAAEVGKQFSANLEPMADALATMASGLKEVTDRLEKLEKEQAVKDRTEKPRFVFEWKRASEDEKTVVTEDDALKDRKPVETTKANANDPWSQMFNK